ncbi:MAG: hypothetical protein DF168_01267 [Candidatus Moanabacter tarae]|uniref:Uncharacterized protein n=1 Tax=Candidatus Moanibacter tarae TaxID=2200854 RepID=A0A2Z4AIV8_9BACT|nr:MAG: hypothetical protein DF168_01267 [Candidatus Moanabacter tarae]
MLLIAGKMRRLRLSDSLGTKSYKYTDPLDYKLSQIFPNSILLLIDEMGPRSDVRRIN